MPKKWPLVGRGEEFRLVLEAFGTSGTSGVVLAGSAGVGKTRLAREALNAAARGGAATLWAVATASAASIPLGALAHLLPPISPRAPPDPLEALRQVRAPPYSGHRWTAPPSSGCGGSPAATPCSCTR